jgi:hypothetical protein
MAFSLDYPAMYRRSTYPVFVLLEQDLSMAFLFDFVLQIATVRADLHRA